MVSEIKKQKRSRHQKYFRIMQRVTRNTGSNVNLNRENANLIGKKNVPLKSGAAKRKALDDVNNSKKSTKRATLGDITNNTALKQVNDVGKQGLKDQVKKGFNTFVEKGKTTLRNSNTSLRSSLRRKNVVTKEEASSSSSSEEAIMCVMDSSKSSESANDSSLVKEDVEPEVPTVFICPDPSRKVPPEDVPDFDGETLGDPLQHSDYVMETFQYYKDREAVFKVGDYIPQQHEITETMRSILVDWLVEVQESFELNHETLYTAVKITDLYLSKKQVKKEDLQLVGVTACLIACKIDERLPPLVDDFLYVCDDAYTRDELMKLERKMLNVVGFDLGYSLSYRFLRRYGRVCKVSMPVLTLARYILETSLMEYSLNIETSESKLAAAAMVLALTMKDITGYKATLEYYSGYRLTDLNNIVQKLLKMLQRPAKENLKTIRSKYSHQVFHEVATTPVPDSVNILDMDN